MGPDDTAPATADWHRLTLSLHARLGRYVLRGVLGTGGMGVVFEAVDPELDRHVAVKILRARARGFDGLGAARLRREGVIMARLTHPNVIRVYDVGVADDHVFVAMELVRGATLAEWVTRGERTPEEIIATYVQAGRGLAAAHDAGLVHRDFKPQNVLVGDDGRVLVTDFGLALSIDDEPELPAASPGSSADDALVRTGEIVGTPAYMAPEQTAGGVVDARADQYSFCLALWRALVGPTEDAHRVPARIRDALARGREVEPARRFDSIHQLLARLEPRPSRAWPWAVAVAGVVAATAVALLVRERSSHRAAPADVCAAADDRFGAVWNDEARGALRSAFAATGLTYADASYREVVRQLDARARAWESARRDSCEDTQVRRAQSDAMMDLRAACLDRRLGDVAAFVAELRHADAAAVGGAAAAATSVGDVSACDDGAALARRAPLPADAGAQGTIGAIEQALSAARASIAAAHLQVGLTQAQDALARARATGYAPLVAAALVVAGEAEVALDHGEPARALYEEAVLVAEAGGDDLLRFECEAALVRIYGYQLERDADATVHARRADALIQRLGPDPRRAALLARNRATADWWAGRYEVGRGRAEEAIAIYQRLDPAGADLAKTLHLRAILENEMRDDQATIATEARALPIAEAALGADHQIVAAILQTGAGSMAKLGRFAEARARYQRALGICEATFGASAMRTAAVLLDLATVDMKEEHFADAVPILRRALAIFEEVSGPEHSRTALACERLGSALSQAGQHAEGERYLRRAIAIHTARLGADSPAAAASVKVLGKHFARTGQHGAARDAFTEAVRALDASQGPGSKLSINPLLLLGDEERVLGHRAAAAAAYRRAQAAVAPDDAAAQKEIADKLGAITP